tara:strand:+ start:6198 stop:6899 length:702 start_codon:yes stop_codon:yes gene_type:complete
MLNTNNLTGRWKEIIDAELEKDYAHQLTQFLSKETVNVYPAKEEIFNAFESTPFENLKVVICGQDPYFIDGFAHGLSFSIKHGVKIPRSLSNIYKELKGDLEMEAPGHGNLQQWCDQGVLLLNNVLTVREGDAGSHRKKGWEQLTAKIIDTINNEHENIVFLAWGRDAHKLTKDIDTTKHKVIKTSHPSPLGATKSSEHFSAFIGSKCFSEANDYLTNNSHKPVNWLISNMTA